MQVPEYTWKIEKFEESTCLPKMAVSGNLNIVRWVSLVGDEAALT